MSTTTMPVGATGPARQPDPAPRPQVPDDHAPGTRGTPGTPGRPSFGAALARRWAAGWLALVHLVLDVLVGAISVAVPTLLITGVLSLPAAGLGILLLLAAIWLAAGIAWFERLRGRAFLGIDVRQGDQPADRPWWWRLAFDPRRWRETAGATLLAVWGLLVGTATLIVVTWALAVLLSPLQWGYISEYGLSLVTAPGWSMWAEPLVRVEDGVGLAAAWVLALVVLLLAPLAASYVALVDAHLIRWLFGEDPDRRVAHLEQRAEHLNTSRQEAVAGVEAERRRIERDLHDGPQQRLVSVAMDLGMARAALHTDPGAAEELLDKAHASAKEAIVEMRQVARGIVPPVLADRGLDAAFSALAVRTPLPVEVRVDPRIGRMDATVEAIAYFCVSEALTNVAKHAGASSARVGLAPADDGSPRVVLTIEDDGAGGAWMPPAPEAHGGSGTGLAGLRQRVASVDGWFQLYSPPGGPTLLTLTLPWLPARPDARAAADARHDGGAR